MRLTLTRLAAFALAALTATPALALSPVANPQPSSLTLKADLKNAKLPQQTEGETFVRIAVTGQKAAAEKRLPLNIALVIDRSGSMSGTGPTGTNKMEDAKRAAKQLLEQLGEIDRFSVLSFDDGAELLGQGFATPQEIQKAIARIDQLGPRGGTDMVSGLSQGIAAVRKAYEQTRTNRVVLLSDGVPNTAQGLVEMSRDAAKKGVQVTTIGVGTDYNEDLMSKIADAGAGNYYFIKDGPALAGILQKELKELMAVVGREAMLKVEFASGIKPVKVFGYDAKLTNETAIITLGDLFGGQTAEVLVKVRHPKLEGEKLVAQVNLGYFDALHKKDSSAAQAVKAEFVGDPKLVTASVNKEAAAKVEKVAAAEALEDAMKKVQEGKADEAKKILTAQRTRSEKARAELGLADDKDVGGDAVVEFEQSLASGGASAAPAAAAMVKSAKMRARDMAH